MREQALLTYIYTPCTYPHPHTHIHLPCAIRYTHTLPSNSRHPPHLRPHCCVADCTQAFRAPRPGAPLGFRRQPLDAALQAHRSPSAAPPPAPGMTPVPSSAPPRRLVRFDGLVTPALQVPLAAASGPAARVSQYSGVFVCSPRPLWLVAARGGLQAHPADPQLGAVDAFTAFHNANCPHGFIAAAAGGNMNICTLPLMVRRQQCAHQVHASHVISAVALALLTRHSSC